MYEHVDAWASGSICVLAHADHPKHGDQFRESREKSENFEGPEKSKNFKGPEKSENLKIFHCNTQGILN